ncbi:Hypothetical predicted protein [Cloeon dipterum]|uniref:Ig-like domain-containing protein n=1 Tax=Cloeon dipterum TaxID=197152 RepID=A0A8S1CDD9_9INSE|nr:Hypothetical predicted protein [Cloeon dipterum]
MSQGQSMKVTCQVVEGDGPIRIHWRYQGRPISAAARVSVVSLGEDAVILGISAVQAEHAGEYACVAQNLAGQHHHASMLAVDGPIMPFSFGEESINAGDFVSTQCSIIKGDSPISIAWYFNSSEIESTDQITVSKIGKKGSALTIDATRAVHMGEYTCVAKNAAGSTNFTTYLHINVLPQIVPFSFGDEIPNAGELASLQCSVIKGDSPITLGWLFNGTEIESTDDTTISKIGRKISSLSIESVHASHVGEYTCVAKNAAGATNYSAFLQVNVLPQIIPFTFGDEIPNVGELASLQCSVIKGDSPISISWLFNGTELESSDEIVISKISRKVSALTIESVHASHIGEYTCLAKNAAGATNYSALLHVNVLPQIAPFTFGDESLNAGELVTATCSITKGDSPISISWFFNTSEIESGDGDVVISKISKKVSALTIESARANHMGEYTCVAKNAAGASNFSTSLHVNG